MKCMSEKCRICLPQMDLFAFERDSSGINKLKDCHGIGGELYVEMCMKRSTHFQFHLLSQQPNTILCIE